MTTIVAGAFDGVHVGHSRLLSVARDLSRSEGDPLVGVVILRRGNPRHLMPIESRLRELLRRGCATAVSVEVDGQVDGETIHRIAEHTGAARAVVARLPSRRQQPGVDVIEVGRSCDSDGIEITSSRIADAVSSGDVCSAAILLGRPYAVRGTVIHGAKLGRTIGFPTANLAPPLDLVIPPHGVYAAYVRTPVGRRYLAAVNVGVRPTVVDSTQVLIEAHVLGFDADLYGQEISVEFHQRVRGENRFESLDALRAQLERDVQSVRGLARERADVGWI